ncbi:MAG: outer membrane beta-barrel protein, partial [Planctomycetota bacterium]
MQAWASAGGAIGFNTPYENFLPVGFSNRDIWQLNEVGAIVKHGIEADRPWRHCTKCRSRWGYRIDGFYGPNARFLNSVGFESTWVNDVYQWALPNAYASYAIDNNTKVRVGNTLSPFADEQELYSLHNPVQTKSLLSLFNPIT